MFTETKTETKTETVETAPVNEKIYLYGGKLAITVSDGHTVSVGAAKAAIKAAAGTGLNSKGNAVSAKLVNDKGEARSVNAVLKLFLRWQRTNFESSLRAYQLRIIDVASHLAGGGFSLTIDHNRASGEGWLKWSPLDRVNNHTEDLDAIAQQVAVLNHNNG